MSVNLMCMCYKSDYIFIIGTMMTTQKALQNFHHLYVHAKMHQLGNNHEQCENTLTKKSKYVSHSILLYGPLLSHDLFGAIVERWIVENNVIIATECLTSYDRNDYTWHHFEDKDYAVVCFISFRFYSMWNI